MALHSSLDACKPFVRQVAGEVDAKFPRREWTSTYAHHGENSATGAYAVDFLCDRATGDKIADYLWANRARFGLWYLIWYGRIRSRTDGEGAQWKRYYLADDPNPSKSHKNHVHASFYTTGSYRPATPAPKPAAPKPTAPAKPVVVEAPTPPAAGPRPRFVKVAYVNPSGEGNWQGAIPTREHWYVAEARKQADGSEDTYVYRFRRGAEGATLTTTEAPFRLNASAGHKVHPTGWGVSDSGVLWFTWNGEGSGNDVVTANYAPGQSVTKAQCQQMHMFTEGNAQVAFDVDNEMASVRVITTGHDTHHLRTKQDILDDVDRVLGVVKIKRRADRVVQGFTLVKTGPVWELRVLVGLTSARSAFGIERWNATTGQHLGTLALPQTLGREPEGIDGDLVGFKTENRSGLDVYRYTV